VGQFRFHVIILSHLSPHFGGRERATRAVDEGAQSIRNP
jgi:hypothetical protein